MAETQITEVKEIVTGDLKFGIGQLNNPQPMWSKWAFRIALYLGAAIIFVAVTDDAIPAQTVKNVVKYTMMGIVLVHGFSKMLGIDISKDAQDAKDAFKPMV